MRVSVIIPTYQGCSKILSVIESLLRQTIKNFEVIVVIDGSTDNTKQVLSKPFETISLRIIDQANKGRAGARNAGAGQANGELLIFFDDDILPESDSVERHVKFHMANHNAILIGNTPQAVYNIKNDFHQYRSYISQRWMTSYTDEVVPLNKGSLFLTAANFSIGKKLFLQMGGFNEKLRDAEDKELGIRAFKADIPLYFDKQNVAWHHENISCHSYILRLRQYAISNREVNSLHPGFLTKRETTLSVFKKAIYFFLATSWVVRIIDSFNIFIILPSKMRYKMYDAITFSLSEVYPEVRL